jgi:hypothetical protein
MDERTIDMNETVENEKTPVDTATFFLLIRNIGLSFSFDILSRADAQDHGHGVCISNTHIRTHYITVAKLKECQQDGTLDKFNARSRKTT